MTKIICDHCGKELDRMKDYDDISIETMNSFYDTDLCADCRNELSERMDKMVKEFIGKED
ncbi:MAG: hypothetical protein IJ308_08515 [Clostridia bacterium]|nr:hypothetical protein [Clostridia bacterium]